MSDWDELEGLLGGSSGEGLAAVPPSPEVRAAQTREAWRSRMEWARPHHDRVMGLIERFNARFMTEANEREVMTQDELDRHVFALSSLVIAKLIEDEVLQVCESSE